MSRETLGDLVASRNPPTYTISHDWVVNTANSLRHRGVGLAVLDNQSGIDRKRKAHLACTRSAVSKLDHEEVVPT